MARAHPVSVGSMEFQQVVDRRRMVRNYDPDRPVPPEVLDRLMANALHAPSAGFSQGWGFLVLTERADRRPILGGDRSDDDRTTPGCGDCGGRR